MIDTLLLVGCILSLGLGVGFLIGYWRGGLDQEQMEREVEEQYDGR